MRTRLLILATAAASGALLLGLVTAADAQQCPAGTSPHTIYVAGRAVTVCTPYHQPPCDPGPCDPTAGPQS